MPIELICNNCKKSFKVKPSHAPKRKCCSKICYSEYAVMSGIFKGNNNAAHGKTYRTKKTHPEWAEKISKTSKGKVNIGDKNGMKKLEARAKVSKTRKKLFRKNPEMAKNLGKKVSQAWADGKYKGVAVGRCKWYSHIKPDGTTIKCQGTWELAFAKWLDKQQLQYDAHKGRIPYIDKKGNNRNYYPDFYVYEWAKFIDIKNKYHYSFQKEKFKSIWDSNPDKVVEILLKEDLEKMGVEI